MPAPGWYDDPTGRHEHRYWTGALWSRHVATDGDKTWEPLESTTAEEAAAASNGYAYSQFDDDAPPPRQPRRRRRLLAALVVAVAVASAGAVVLFVKSPDASERNRQAIAEPMDPVVAALVVYLDDRSAGALTEADGQCMAEKIVEAVGTARLVEVGVDTGVDPLIALTPEEIHTGLPTVFQCLDDDAAQAFMTATFSPNALDQLNLQTADCLVEGWMTGLGRDKLVELFSLWAARQGAEVTASLDAGQLGVLADVVTRCSTAPPS